MATQPDVAVLQPTQNLIKYPFLNALLTETNRANRISLALFFLFYPYPRMPFSIRKRILFLSLSLNLIISALSAQVQYQIKPLADGITTGTGIALTLGSAYLTRQMDPLTQSQVLDLQANHTIPRFDRYATRHYSVAAEHFSDWAGMASLALPLLAFTGRQGRQQAGEIGIIVLEGALWTTSLTNLTKALARRPRPYVLNTQVPLADQMTREARLSYFSGHVSISAYTSFVGARMFADLYPNSRWKPVVWTAAALIPAAAAYGRMRSGRHYLSDVISGYLVGAAVGWLTPRLHRAF